MPVEVVADRSAESRRAQRRLAAACCEAAVGAAKPVMVALCPVGVGGGHDGEHLFETVEGTPEGQTERSWGAEASVKVGDPSIGIDYATYVVFGTSRQNPQDFVGPGFEAGRRAFEARAREGA